MSQSTVRLLAVRRSGKAARLPDSGLVPLNLSAHPAEGGLEAAAIWRRDVKTTLLGGHGLDATSQLGGQSAGPEALETVCLDVGPDHTKMRTVDESTTRRTTVLPQRGVGAGSPMLDMRPRFQRVKTLGEGGMGSVELVRDNDIRRTVAVKRLRSGTDTPAAQARFADEIRVVGQLEHPGIVPIYDVDRGDDGQLYLVMKHLQGETMEQVIENLRGGDPACVQRFSIEYRVRVFLGVLDAMSYAHSRGVLHRDLKPANIMIGPYGEVTVVDWGIAKPLPVRTLLPRTDPLAGTVVGSQDARLLQTQAGALAGTPLYMSPEQAGALNDDLDERSDVYTLCVLLYEWLVLQHPLHRVEGLPQVLATLVLNDYTLEELFEPAQRAGVPMELIWIVRHGVIRDRTKRYQSVKELEAALNAVMDGQITAQCDITLTKRHAQLVLRWIDRNARLYTLLFRSMCTLAIAGLAGAVMFALVWLLNLAI